MNVNVSIMLVSGDTWSLTPDEAAQAILDALKGDEKKDIVNLSVSGGGSAGNIPKPPEPPAPIAMNVPSPMPPSA